MELQRELVKYTRDYIKKHYIKSNECYICKSKEELELHHIYSISDLLHTWIKKSNLIIETAEEIKVQREIFYKENFDLLTPENCFTLCKKHHLRLHSIYGQNYESRLAVKVKNWIIIQRSKFN